MKRHFKKLVKTHQDRLFSIAHGMLGATGEAEEVVQDAFVKLWEHLADLDAQHVLPWLIRVTRNGCLDLLRRRKYGQAFAVSNGPDEQIELETPVERCAAESLGGQLREAIANLSEPFRSLILLREVEGLEYQAIGEALSLNDSQVKVYLHRARRKLRHALREFA